MRFVLSEFTKAPKHYKITQRIETAAGLVWKEIASVSKRSTAFFYMTLLEKLSK